jgi:hypothetical protein
MQIRFIKKWKTYVKGDYTNVNDKVGQALVDEGIAIDESGQHKAIDKPENDKMVRNYKRK